ncbi:IclR family transcriptional regulator [Pandoraea thiooxydans]|uniref:IclR family transcriptional regulator n=1 Tax=Pandoraea thiooxydans TaxID=445709 RepID=A0A0G3EV88_9BURK|nr:IclR family transcriptional regulator [Pandoraea thiooxydans]AKJ69292.1 IclR family transcriptional regulator [Pandoraea thiooxydans]APR96902.1 IclR family transcriptional regulator [Pandoraea thiooxydans]
MNSVPNAESADLEPEEKLRSGIQSIEVGFKLIEVLTHATQALMLRDLAQLAGMSPAKAHRYLVSFQRLGLVIQDPISGRYDLGPFSLRMGLACLSRVDAFKQARIALTDLRDSIDQTVGIAVWGNHGPTVVHWMEASHTLRVSLRLGDVMPMLTSATGRLFAAYLPPRHTAPLIEAELAEVQGTRLQGMPTTRQAYDALLDDVRAHGAARVEGTLLPSIHAFCMPVLDATGQLVMGLLALGSEARFDSRWGGPIDTALRTLSQRLSADMGYIEP